MTGQAKLRVMQSSICSFKDSGHACQTPIALPTSHSSTHKRSVPVSLCLTANDVQGDVDDEVVEVGKRALVSNRATEGEGMIVEDWNEGVDDRSVKGRSEDASMLAPALTACGCQPVAKPVAHCPVLLRLVDEGR